MPGPDPSQWKIEYVYRQNIWDPASAYLDVPPTWPKRDIVFRVAWYVVRITLYLMYSNYVQRLYVRLIMRLHTWVDPSQRRAELDSAQPRELYERARRFSNNLFWNIFRRELPRLKIIYTPEWIGRQPYAEDRRLAILNGRELAETKCSSNFFRNQDFSPGEIWIEIPDYVSFMKANSQCFFCFHNIFLAI